MQIKTLKFGTLEANETDVIRFFEGIPGLPALRQFVLCKAPDLEPFKILQSIDAPEISFLLVVPNEIFPEYSNPLDDEIRRRLDLEQGHPPAIYAIVTPAQRVEQSTVNLLAPIIINPTNMRGCQVVREDSTYQVRESLFTGSPRSPQG